MAVNTLFPIIAAFVGASIAWFASWERARSELRRTRRVEYLTNAYNGLLAAGHGQAGLQTAVDLVFLYGSPEQVGLLRDALESGPGASLNDLILSVRDDLRQALGLPADPSTDVPFLTEAE